MLSISFLTKFLFLFFQFTSPYFGGLLEYFFSESLWVRIYDLIDNTQCSFLEQFCRLMNMFHRDPSSFLFDMLLASNCQKHCNQNNMCRWCALFPGFFFFNHEYELPGLSHSDRMKIWTQVPSNCYVLGCEEYQ